MALFVRFPKIYFIVVTKTKTRKQFKVDGKGIFKRDSKHWVVQCIFMHGEVYMQSNFVKVLHL